MIDQPVARPLPTHRTRQIQNKRIHTPNIHALSGIRTHDPSVQANEDSSCFRPRGYFDRLWVNTPQYIYVCVFVCLSVCLYILSWYFTVLVDKILDDTGWWQSPMLLMKFNGIFRGLRFIYLFIQLFNQLSTLHETNVRSVYTEPRQRTLFWISSVAFRTPHYISLRSILVSPIYAFVLCCVFPWDFPRKYYVYFPFLASICLSLQSHASWFSEPYVLRKKFKLWSSILSNFLHPPLRPLSLNFIMGPWYWSSISGLRSTWIRVPERWVSYNFV
jgi:hypothetical protein